MTMHYFKALGYGLFSAFALFAGVTARATTVPPEVGVKIDSPELALADFDTFDTFVEAQLKNGTR